MSRPKGSKNKKTVEKEIDIATVPMEIEEDTVVAHVSDEDEDDPDHVMSPDDEEDAADLEFGDVDEGDDDEDDAPPPGMKALPVLEARDQAVIEAIKSLVPQQQVSFAKFTTKSSFNPTGKRRTMKRICYQNGYRCNVKTLFDEEIALIERLKPGRYINNLVTVTLERNPDGGEDKVYIHYSNSTPDQRMNFKNYVRSFVSLLRKCVNESDARVAARKAKRG